VQAVTAASGLEIGTGERYLVVIDFTTFAVGDEIILQNDPSEFDEVSVL
jgi:hypothetical protein